MCKENYCEGHFDKCNHGEVNYTSEDESSYDELCNHPAYEGDGCPIETITSRQKYRNGVARLFGWYGIDMMNKGVGWQLWTDIAEYFTHE